jgi:ribose 5-phosphate isomerase B
MKIAFSNDHAGAPARDQLLKKIRELGHEVLDFGTPTSDAPVDYPDVAAAAVEAMLRGEADRTVLVCGSGIGMSMAANKFPGVRCALVTDLYGAELSRRHNDANCLALRAREQPMDLNEQIVELWLATPFDGGRHQRRVDKIDSNAGK